MAHDACVYISHSHFDNIGLCVIVHAVYSNIHIVHGDVQDIHIYVHGISGDVGDVYSLEFS